MLFPKEVCFLALVWHIQINLQMHHWQHQQSCRLVNLWGIWPWLDWLSKSDNCNCWITKIERRENFWISICHYNEDIFFFLNMYLCLQRGMRILNRANDHYILCHNVMFFTGTSFNIYNTFKRVVSPCWIRLFTCKFVV